MQQCDNITGCELADSVAGAKSLARYRPGSNTAQASHDHVKRLPVSVNVNGNIAVGKSKSPNALIRSPNSHGFYTDIMIA